MTVPATATEAMVDFSLCGAAVEELYWVGNPRRWLCFECSEPEPEPPA
jgi:hypothetical protein